MHALGVVAGILGAVGACSEPTGPVRRDDLRVDPSWVIGEAAAGVDPTTGLFILAPPAAHELSLAAAESAAVAYIRFSLNPGTLGNGREVLESDRGAPIGAWDRLSPCGRSIHVRTPFAPAAATAPRNLVRHLKSAWSVTLCGPNQDPQLGIGVADTRSGARFVGPDYLAADIDSIRQMHTSVGIPRSRSGGLQPSAEAVVGALYGITGIPVTHVPRPQLTWRPPMTIPMYPIWELETAATFSGRFEDGAETGPISLIYAGLFALDSLGFFVAAESQPNEVWMPFPVSFDPLVLDSVAVSVLHPISFRRVLFP